MASFFNIDFDIADATSRSIQQEIDDDGGFVVAPSGSLLTEENQDDIPWLPNWIEKPIRGIVNLGKTILGWAGKVLGWLGGFISWSFSSLVGWLSAAGGFLWNFDWSISEEAIESQLKSSLQALAGQAGGFVGQALGWAFCGAVPGIAILTFNEALGLKVLREVGEEAFDELASSFGALINQAARSLISYGFLKLYASSRRAYWRIFRKGEKYPDFSKRQPWSFNTGFENRIEKLNPMLGSFLEELREEFAESCTEAGYVVANSLDSFFAQQAVLDQQRNAANPQRILEIEFEG